MGILAHLSPRLYHYARLMRLQHPVGKLLLLWPPLIALWFASDGHPQPALVLIFTLGSIVMSCAGCVINDFADRHFDGHVQRTKQRPIVSGQVSPQEALLLFMLLLALAFVLVLFTNVFTICLSLGALVLATCYPFMKRYTHFPQVVLGAAYGWAVPMAYGAVGKSIPVECWLLYGATLLWAVAYDTLYAMVDKDDDLKIGVKSTAIAFGQFDKLMVGICHALMLGLYVILGFYLQRGYFFFTGIAIAALLAGYQQWLVKDRDKSACLAAFLNNQWIGAALFMGTFWDFAL